MSFIAKNPVVAPKIASPPPTPPVGSRGLFPTKDGWYDIDDTGAIKKINGEDGVSPTVTLVETTNGYSMTVTDATGSKTFEVLNGVDGKDGTDGEDGKDGYTPQRGVDYWTDEDKAEIKDYVDAAILGGAW